MRVSAVVRAVVGAVGRVAIVVAQAQPKGELFLLIGVVCALDVLLYAERALAAKVAVRDLNGRRVARSHQVALIVGLDDDRDRMVPHFAHDSLGAVQRRVGNFVQPASTAAPLDVSRPVEAQGEVLVINPIKCVVAHLIAIDRDCGIWSNGSSSSSLSVKTMWYLR